MIRLRLSSLIYVRCVRRARCSLHGEARSKHVWLPRSLQLPPQPPLLPDQRQLGHDRSHQHLNHSRAYLANGPAFDAGVLHCGIYPTAMATESSFHEHVCPRICKQTKINRKNGLNRPKTLRKSSYLASSLSMAITLSTKPGRFG